MNTTGSARIPRLLGAAITVALLQVSVVPPIQAHAAPAARIYLIGGGRVEALDALTLAPLPPNGITNRLREAPVSSQLVQSPDGSRLGIILGNAGAGSHPMLTVINTHTNTIKRRDPAGGLALLGVSNDGRGWYGTYTEKGGRLLRFVSARAGQRHTLDFHLAQPCCVLFQYDSSRDRLYALTLRTVWNAGVPESAMITAWQLSSRHRIASLSITGLIAGTRIIAGSQVPVDRAIPGFALSPDGKTLAILDFSDRRLNTIDALRLRWTRNPFVSGWGSSSETTLGPTTRPSPRLSGVEGYDINTQFSLDGRILYLEGTENTDHKTPFIFSEALATRAIDVAHSALRAAVWAPLVAPLMVGTDGASVYTAIFRSRGKRIAVVVQRRRYSNLSVIAERSIPSFATHYSLLDLSR